MVPVEYVPLAALDNRVPRHAGRPYLSHVFVMHLAFSGWSHLNWLLLAQNS